MLSSGLQLTAHTIFLQDSPKPQYTGGTVILIACSCPGLLFEVLVVHLKEFSSCMARRGKVPTEVSLHILIIAETDP